MTTIESNFESICINPNDDLVLYNKEIIRSRIEKFLYAICSLDTDDLPTPLSRIEELYNCLVTGGDIPTFTPLSRAEKFVMAMLGAYDVELLPTPISRSETLMKKIATGDNNLDDVDNLQSRYEFLLAYIIKSGGFNGGNGDFYYVNYPINNSVITLYNTVDYPVKSAILKGRSLVNLLKVNKDDYSITINSQNWYVEDGYLKCISTTGWHSVTDKFSSSIKPNTKYLIFVEIKENNLNIDINFDGFGTTLSSSFPFLTFEPNEVGTKKTIVTTSSTIDNIKHGFFRMPINIPNNNSILKFRVMAIEYQEGMENWDISYFEGMQSVKMPVLTTVGKNLYNKTPFNGYIDSSNGKFVKNNASTRKISDYIEVKPNTMYKVSGCTMAAMWGYDKDKNPVSAINIYTDYITTTNDMRFIAFSINSELEHSNIQIEEGLTATSYEPHKSTTVSCNEEVELGGIGDIKDELNLTTGELTQRIDEFVFDGSSDELWFITTNDSGLKRFVSDVKKTHTNYSEITNWLPTAKSYWSLDKNGFYIGANGSPVIVFNTNDSRYNMSITELENYLSQNPLIVQSPLIESVIKTVDLSVVNQDGKKTKLSTFDDITHVIASSEGLVPTGEITVATKNATDVIDASIMSLRTDDILNSQRTLEGSANAQSDDIDVAMLGMTDIYEQLL